MKISKDVILSATFMPDGQEPVVTFNASIRKGDPNSSSYTSSIINADLYREYRDKIEEARKEFEDEFYAEKDSMAAAAGEEG